MSKRKCVFGQSTLNWKQILASWEVDVRLVCMWTDSKSRHASLRMVRLINNLYGKEKMAILLFDLISLTTRIPGSSNNIPCGGFSLIHFECAALSREIDYVLYLGLGNVVWGHKIWHQCSFPLVSSFIYTSLYCEQRQRLMEFSRTRLKLGWTNAASLH